MCPRAPAQGEWSRLRFMQDARRHGAAAIRDFTAVLPRSARSLYFRDEIGNVSTSAVRRLRDKLDVRLQPRFTLFGGWQARPCARADRMQGASAVQGCSAFHWQPPDAPC